MGTVSHRGAEYPVTDAWHLTNSVPFPDLAELSRDQLLVIQRDLQTASNFRQLTTTELARLRAANNHFDVRTSIDLLGGRQHTEFGFAGVDQLHHNRQTFPCGCQLNVVFDHHGTEDRVLHPHTPRHVCDLHVKHKDDLHKLHAAVAADHSVEV